MRWIRVGLGLLLVAAGCLATFAPSLVRGWLDEPHRFGWDAIEWRVMRGGAVAGLGLFLLATSTLRPIGVTLARFALWLTFGLLAARIVGMAFDGWGFPMQWLWVGVEGAVIAGALIYLGRHA